MWQKIGRYHGWIFLILFFCSGATALIYEVIWSKYLSQMFGSTIQAQTVVLAVFMGGLALGNCIFGRKSDRFKRPVRVYGELEMIIGLYAFFFHTIYSQADNLFVALGTRWFHQPQLLLALKAALATGLMLGPTILMGGTLPLLAAWLQKNYSEAGRGSALFYAINSLGAVAGSGIAGFYLVQTLGMVASLQATALVNFAIGGIAFVLGKQESQTQTQAQPVIEAGGLIAPTPAPAPAVPSSRPLRWAGLMVAITGGVSMGLEVLASRGLSLIFGSSLQSFAIVLMAFILGIGLGSSVIASLKLRRVSNEALIAVLLLVASAWIGVLVLNIEGWVEFFRIARTGIARTTIGYIFNQALSAVMSMFILGVPAALIGSVLPLLIRVLAGEGAALGKHVGRLLTSNTVGAVAGVLLTGFVIMPKAGLRNAFLILALGLAVVGSFFALRNQWRLFPGAVTVGLVAVLVFGGESWRHVMSSGVFRAREVEVNKEFMALRKERIKILFYEDAPDATVSVEKRVQNGVEQIGLRINGKPDASSHGDLCTQMLVGHLPVFARPNSKDVFLLGMGSGITASAVLAHPIDKLVLAENCKPVIKAAELFAEYNRGVLTNSRMQLCYEDARTVLKLSPQQYDVIIAEPSNPWTVGVGSVFSKEFYEMCAGKLKDGGIMTQWFHVYEMHDGIVGLVLRTFGTVFPYFEIWDCNNGDIVMLGALQPWESSPEAYAAGITGRQLVVSDLKRVGINSPTALFARQLASQKTAFAIAGDGPIQQDWMPVLEYQAPKAFFLGGHSRILSRFDERTWQVENAPSAKRAALQKLSDDDLRSIFTEHLSVNDDIVTFVRNRLSAPTQPTDPKQWVNFREPPFIFRPVNPSPASGANLDEHEKALLEARRIIETNPARQKEAVETIARLLAQPNADAKWPVATYAALAAKVSLRGGDYARAKDLLQTGLKAKPDDTELQYLSRILDRFGG